MKNDKDLSYRALLNALPFIIFVVDADVQIRDFNNAAATVFGPDQANILKRRGGEVMHCLHSYDVPDGCGRAPFCQTCIIRSSVTASLHGQTVTRKRTMVELLHEGKRKELELLITASPMPGGEEPLSVLIIEDITEFSRLKDIIPICLNCKNVRDDQEYWQSLEKYFNEYIGVDFAHSYCPKCKKRLNRDISRY